MAMVFLYRNTGREVYISEKAPALEMSRGTSEYQVAMEKIWELRTLFPSDYDFDKCELMKLWNLCTLLPRDYEFDKDKLVQLWKASTLTEDKFADNIFDSLFDILLSCGYILQFRTCLRDKYKWNVKWFHDEDEGHYLMLKSLDCTVPEKVEYLSLLGDEMDDEKLEALARFKNLKVLLLVCNNPSRISKMPDVFPALEHLEILDLSKTSIKELPDSIGCFVSLKYLDLSFTPIELLPETIDRLWNLQTLKLEGCERLHRLPERMGSLISLVHLEFDILGQLSFMPEGMGALTNLETLSAFLVDSSGVNIAELESMNNLKGKFCLSGLENVESRGHAMKAALGKKCLDKLELRWSDLHQPWDMRYDEYDILSELSPVPTLRELKISCYGGCQFPDWINTSTTMLTEMTLFKCENIVQLPSVSRMPYLRVLRLIEMNSVEKIEAEFWTSDHMVLRLERLEIISFAVLQTWEAYGGEYETLKELIIERCPRLTALPLSPLCSPNLNHLEIIDCPLLSALPGERLSRSLETLVIEDCPLIEKRLRKRSGEEWNKIRHVKSARIDQDELIKGT